MKLEAFTDQFDSVWFHQYPALVLFQASDYS